MPYINQKIEDLYGKKLMIKKALETDLFTTLILRLILRTKIEFFQFLPMLMYRKMEVKTFQN
jgi:hypothetical protein